MRGASQAVLSYYGVAGSERIGGGGRHGAGHSAVRLWRVHVCPQSPTRQGALGEHERARGHQHRARALPRLRRRARLLRAATSTSRRHSTRRSARPAGKMAHFLIGCPVVSTASTTGRACKRKQHVTLASSKSSGDFMSAGIERASASSRRRSFDGRAECSVLGGALPRARRRRSIARDLSPRHTRGARGETRRDPCAPRAPHALGGRTAGSAHLEPRRGTGARSLCAALRPRARHPSCRASRQGLRRASASATARASRTSSRSSSFLSIAGNWATPHRRVGPILLSRSEVRVWCDTSS